MSLTQFIVGIEMSLFVAQNDKIFEIRLKRNDKKKKGKLKFEKRKTKIHHFGSERGHCNFNDKLGRTLQN